MPRPKNTETRRRQIGEALVKVMATRGYEGASMLEIAAAAKLTPGLIHYHFASKQEILLSVLAEMVAQHDAGLEAALGAAGEDAAAQLEAFIDCHLATGKRANADALACWVALSGEALRQREVSEALGEVLAGLVSRLERIIARGVAAGDFTCTSSRAAASALIALVEGYFVVAAIARSQIPRHSAAGAAKKMAAGLLGMRWR